MPSTKPCMHACMQTLMHSCTRTRAPPTPTQARLCIFYSDWHGVKGLLAKAQRLCDSGGDWERKNKLKVYQVGADGAVQRWEGGREDARGLPRSCRCCTREAALAQPVGASLQHAAPSSLASRESRAPPATSAQPEHARCPSPTQQSTGHWLDPPTRAPAACCSPPQAVLAMYARDFKLAASLFHEALATFSAMELFPYERVVFYAVVTAVISMDRVALKAKVRLPDGCQRWGLRQLGASGASPHVSGGLLRVGARGKMGLQGLRSHCMCLLSTRLMGARTPCPPTAGCGRARCADQHPADARAATVPRLSVRLPVQGILPGGR